MNEIAIASENFALNLIPYSTSAEAEVWNSMARSIVAETRNMMLKRGEHGSESIRHWLAQATHDDLKNLLSNTPAAGCFHGSHDALASARAIIHLHWSAA